MTRSPITALGRTRPRNLTNSGALSAGENDKWQKACCNGAEHDYSNGDNLLCGSHYAFSSLSFILLFRDLVDGSRFSLAALSFTPSFVLGAFTTLAESSNLFRHKKKLKIINAIAGIMKLFFPKISRQAREHMTPIKAGKCRLAVSH